LLAGLNAQGKTIIRERIPTRDHTERMLKLFKADIRVAGKVITLRGGKQIVSPGEVVVPGDISSAAFFMVAAAVIPGSRITLKNISLNPSRTGAIKVLKRMGAHILTARASRLTPGSEPTGDILVKGSRLKAVVVRKNEVPSLIDELPILMVAACFARGRSVFEGAEELRVKETDRIRSMLENLRRMGAEIALRRSGGRESIEVRGTSGLNGAKVKSFADHRTAMSLIVAGLAASGRTEIDEVACIKKSFPGFMRLIRQLGKVV
jgi:3-phosphoshikimate 1-carboxyvinyltransferase